MPERPDHPDHEQLAAFEAGDGDRRERAGVAAHLAGCSSCAEVVASVEQARSHLALLEEPDLPPGLHDRLAAAVEAEAAQTAADRPAARSYRRAARPAAPRTTPRSDRQGEQAPARPTPGTAAPWPGARPPPSSSPPWSSPSSTSPAATAPPPATPAVVPKWAKRPPAPAGPRVQPPGRDLGGDGQRQTGHRPPGQGRPRLRRHRHPRRPGRHRRLRAGPTARPDPGRGRRRRLPFERRDPQAGTADLQPCLPAAAAAADPATRPLVPAFYIEGTYQGQPATVLVTTSNGDPGRVDLWVFPRDNCSPPPWPPNGSASRAGQPPSACGTGPLGG